MNNLEIDGILRRDRYTKAYFRGVFSRNTLPQRQPSGRRAYVCNTDRDDAPGEHWVAMYIDSGDNGFYFDPYGIYPLHNEFSEFMNKNTRCWIFNDKRVQGSHSTVCGQYCVYFILQSLRGKSMETIVAQFNKDCDDNDVQIFDYFAYKYNIYHHPYTM